MSKEVENLAKLVSLQMGGYIILEFVVFFLIVIGVIPQKLFLRQFTSGSLWIDSFFIVIVGLIGILVASFWVGILVTTDIVKMKEVKISF